MKSTQTVFNGYGAQEATDMLVLALIHPNMPAFEVCGNEELWERFVRTLKIYSLDRLSLANSSRGLPYVSSAWPFRFRKNAHVKYLLYISCYRRQSVNLGLDIVWTAHDLNLFNPEAVIQPDGLAVGERVFSSLFTVIAHSFSTFWCFDQVDIHGKGGRHPHR